MSEKIVVPALGESIPEATVVKDGKNQKKISCFTRTVVHYPCVVMLISGVISIILNLVKQSYIKECGN